MTEKIFSESARLDIENRELSSQLFDSVAIGKVSTSMDKEGDFKLTTPDGLHVLQAIPAMGELVYFDKSNSTENSNHLEADMAIKFRRDGTIILTEAENDFRVKYNPKNGIVTRYKRRVTSSPVQILPRHAKHDFLMTILQAQKQISNMIAAQA